MSKKAALFLSALVMLAIGSLVVFTPAVLFGSSGIALDPSAALMSEIRSPGVLILFGGFLALAGLFNRQLERPALICSAALLLCYGLGPLISLSIDGMPPATLLLAAAVELGLGAWCATCLVKAKESAPVLV